jgi:ATP-binding cassette subfamily B protein
LILVLEDGQIVEKGTHTELLERDGFYRNIYDMQLRPQGDDAIPEEVNIERGNP